MPLYEEKMINPLAVRFSQDRIWPDFQDGTRVEDSLGQIGSVELQGAAYDLVLRPPFPPMEIIRLKQERREADGERARDEKGRKLFGEESWFTFDNRRLYCLQRAALRLWPRVVGVVVKVLYDFPEVRCARHKFRTTSDGRTVKISLPDGRPGALWSWEEAAKSDRMNQESAISVLGAVRRDTGKNRKELLADVPPLALLCPGAREATVAERFNLGASRWADRAECKAAGQQLLSLLHGGGGGGGPGGGGGGAGPSAGAAAPPPADTQGGQWQWQQRRQAPEEEDGGYGGWQVQEGEAEQWQEGAYGGWQAGDYGYGCGHGCGGRGGGGAASGWKALENHGRGGGKGRGDEEQGKGRRRRRHGGGGGGKGGGRPASGSAEGPTEQG